MYIGNGWNLFKGITDCRLTRFEVVSKQNGECKLFAMTEIGNEARNEKNKLNESSTNINEDGDKAVGMDKSAHG